MSGFEGSEGRRSRFGNLTTHRTLSICGGEEVWPRAAKGDAHSLVSVVLDRPKSFPDVSPPDRTIDYVDAFGSPRRRSSHARYAAAVTS